MAVTINNQHGVYDNVKDTFPQSTALTGTVSTANNKTLIIGVGTLFSSELQVGEWIFDTTNSEIKQIQSIQSDTELTLKEPFTNSLSGATVKRTPRQTYRMASFRIDDTATAKIDGIEFLANQSGTMGLDEVSRKRPNPIIIDSTTNGNKVYIEILA